MRTVLLLLSSLLLGACAGGPKFVMDDVDTALTPKQTVAEAELHRGKRVLWGGTIVNSSNLRDKTRLEVLAYPLDSDHYPQTDQEPYGRFLLFRKGYLETVDYAPGRRISVVGRLDGTRSGKLDQTQYTYPAVLTEQLHLWPKGEKNNTRFHFGIGVMFSN